MGLVLAALMAVGAVAGGAAAHASSDHGTITWHDSEDGEPQTHTEGKYSNGSVELTCEFWVKGYNMSHAEGDIVAQYNYRSGNPDVMYTESAGHWMGEPNASGGWDFEAGPFTLSEDGTVRGFAVMGDAEHDDKSHPDDYDHRTQTHRVSYETCEEQDGEEKDDEDPAEPPSCPEGLHAEAHGNEDVGLSWNASADAEGYHVYRATEDGEFEHVAEVTSTSYTDQETEAETTYTFEVTAASEAGEAEDCGTVEVTAIPFFGSPALVAMAAVGSLGAVAVARRAR